MTPANTKARLAQAFPGVTFTYYGATVVSWEGGPTIAAVREAAGRNGRNGRRLSIFARSPPRADQAKIDAQKAEAERFLPVLRSRWPGVWFAVNFRGPAGSLVWLDGPPEDDVLASGIVPTGWRLLATTTGKDL